MSKMNIQKTRGLIQIFFFILVGIIAVNHTLVENGNGISWLSGASVHAICPFGGVETLYQLFTTGGFIQKIHESAIVLMGIAFTLAILFGPVICGWVCPLGSIQEWIGDIGRKLFKKQYNHFMPQKIDRVLRYLRYVLLVLVLYNTFRSGMLLFTDIDPYFALFHFWTGETAIMALVILVVTMLLSLVVERPWCKYACPYGALMGLFNPIRLFKIKREESSCISCGLCTQNCPMNIDVASGGAVLNHQCISCLKCTSESHCPVGDTVMLQPVMLQSKMPQNASEKPVKKIGGLQLGIVTLIVIFGGIALTAALGYWSTENTKTPRLIESGAGTGQYNPEDIRGSYTFGEISNLYQIPREVLLEAFGLPMNTDAETFKVKNLETVYEGASVSIGNGSMQMFVALYKGTEVYLGEDFLPKAAVDLIYKNNPNLSEEVKTYLESHTYRGEQAAPDSVSSTPAPVNSTPASASSEASSEPLINGQTTFQGVLNLGISKEQIEEIIGGPMPATNLSVRAYCQDNGMSFSEVKTALNALLN